MRDENEDDTNSEATHHARMMSRQIRRDGGEEQGPFVPLSAGCWEQNNKRSTVSGETPRHSLPQPEETQQHCVSRAQRCCCKDCACSECDGGQGNDVRPKHAALQ